MQIFYFDTNGSLRSCAIDDMALLDFDADECAVNVWLDDGRAPDEVIPISDPGEFKACCRDFAEHIHSNGFDFTPYQPLDDLDPDDRFVFADDPFDEEIPPF